MKKILLVITGLFGLTAGHAQLTVNINPDMDNSIYSENNNSNGTGALFSGETCSGNSRRALLHFDIAGSLPAGATVTAVTLTLNLQNNGGSSSSEDYSLHPVNAAWGEGTSFGTGSGGAAVFPDATWSDAMVGTAWATPGGDFGPAAATTTLTAALGNYNWSSAAMVTNVQNWLNTPATNFGWILIGDESVTCTARRFGSSEQGIDPVLAVTYTCASSPTATCQDVSASLASNGQFILSPASMDNGSVAVCGGTLSFSASQTLFTCSDLGTNPVTLTVTDQFSNTATCNANVIISDNTAPTTLCVGPTTFTLDLTGNLTLTPADIDNGSTDACGIATLSLSQTTFDCNDLGSNAIVLTAIDVNGNVGTCTANITIQSSGGPVITENNVVPPTCNGNSDGSIDVTITGGNPPYILDWDNDGTGDNDDAEDLLGLTGGIYVLNVTDQSGCADTQAVDLVEPDPITATSINTNVSCVGETDGTIDLSPTGGTPGYLFDWDNDGTGDSDDSEDLSGLNFGSYTVLILDANGCTGTFSTTINNAAAVDTAVTQTGFILTANAAGSTFQWIECPSGTPVPAATGVTFAPSADGDYAVVVTNGNGCMDTSSCYTVSGLSLDEWKAVSPDLYPNPANTTIMLVTDPATPFNRFVITDPNGREIMRQNLVAGSQNIDVSALANGIYFITFYAPDRAEAARFVVSH